MPTSIPPTGSITVSQAVRALIEEARRHVGVTEQGGPNRGPMVEKYLRVTGLGPGYPWCAAFVAYVAKQALGKRWPVPLSAACRVVGDWAFKNKCLDQRPTVGALYLVYYAPLHRFAHIGIVTAVHADGTITTIEGNTNDKGGREGWKVCVKKRRPKARDAFVHWGHLLRTPEDK